uniref:Uncharacterized protein n=1 Tax=Rhinolophus ferrumequinum TaxID=59479 RepID=A0A671E752_RHIFE
VGSKARKPVMVPTCPVTPMLEQILKDVWGTLAGDLICTARAPENCPGLSGKLSPGRCGLWPWSMLAVPPFGFLHMCSESQTLNIFSFAPCAQLMQRCPDNPRAQVHVGRM